ncbi:MAG TPA: MBOAT family protein [Polyangia bacterium]|jgi:alginate O-acetyltransferase complex protein AlgI|nr:MBOAT family protein [Polyangia bacterium]
MVFSSPIFLFLFLPLTLAGFFVVPRALRTPFLVLMSLGFYAWGEKQIVLVLLFSIVANWLLALVVERSQRASTRTALLVVAVALNIGALLYFKYFNFIVGNLNQLLHDLGRRQIKVAPVHLPIGVSFVTFEALSFVIDVYRRVARAPRNPLHVAFYVSFFPHLIAGPILRFRDIADAVARPRVTSDGFQSGVARFIVGLGKKMLLANPLGAMVDKVFALQPAQLGCATAWAGIVAYALQIYFDFSGYTDMAIGLGRMFGFSLPENFRLPYAAQSIKDFWRRWHMSLSTWFRDYLFVPLGGSRVGTARTYRNLLIVFFLCGLWHGASWTFVIWGLFHGAFLVLERTAFGRWLDTAPRPLRHGYTLLIVLVGWVFFRAETIQQAAAYLRAMGGATSAHSTDLVGYLSIRVRLAFVLATLGATLPLARWRDRIAPHRGVAQLGWHLSGAVIGLAVLALTMSFVASETYNPFIYFRF